jgi:hypothetical protein
MPELDTRCLLDGGEFWEGHTLLCAECEDPFDYVHPVCVDVDRWGRCRQHRRQRGRLRHAATDRAWRAHPRGLRV